MADELVPGRVDDRDLSLEDRDERVGPIADLVQQFTPFITVVIGGHDARFAVAGRRVGPMGRLPQILSQGVEGFRERAAAEPLKRGDAVAVVLIETLVAEKRAGLGVCPRPAA